MSSYITENSILSILYRIFLTQLLCGHDANFEKKIDFDGHGYQQGSADQPTPHDKSRHLFRRGIIFVDGCTSVMRIEVIIVTESVLRCPNGHNTRLNVLTA